jgi:hypothetical protein
MLFQMVEVKLKFSIAAQPCLSSLPLNYESDQVILLNRHRHVVGRTSDRTLMMLRVSGQLTHHPVPRQSIDTCYKAGGPYRACPVGSCLVHCLVLCAHMCNAYLCSGHWSPNSARPGPAHCGPVFVKQMGSQEMCMCTSYPAQRVMYIHLKLRDSVQLSMWSHVK